MTTASGRKEHHSHSGGETDAADKIRSTPHSRHGDFEARTRHTRHGKHDVHDKHAGHDPEAFRRRFWLSLGLTIPIIATSGMVGEWFGYRLVFPGVAWVGPVLGSFIYLYGGWPFLTGALAEARDRAPGMMLLISMAITVAWSASLATALGAFNLDFWWELAALVTIMLMGHWQEMRAVGQTQGALAALAELLPDEAERIRGDGSLERVPSGELRLGDAVLVRPGGRVPADGLIFEGAADMDESMITGESRPVPRASGDRVVAGTVATDSALRVRIDAVGDDTALAGIQRLVIQAQQSGGRAQALADRFAGLLFYIAVAAAAATFAAWGASGRIDEAVVHAITVLVIACPHALGLAIPLVIALSTGLAARSGILIKDRLALERMRGVSAVLFDKTGTLTRGEYKVRAAASGSGRTDTEVIAVAAAVEADSEHPLARAIVAAAAERGTTLRADSFRALPGLGVRAIVEGREYAVGGPALLRDLGARVPMELAARTAEWAARGAAVLHVLDVERKEAIGAIALEDEVREEARQAIGELRRLGVKRIAMITGDARAVAEAVAVDLGFAPGVDEVFAEILPADKDRVVMELQARGERVVMVGDGVNDAPALARADVGVAIGAGTDVAIESAGVVLASSDPRGVAAAMRLSAASYRKMLQNLAWAAGYNVLAIPLAAGVLAWAGISVGPAAGAVLMSVSTIVVALNAQLLRRVRLTAPQAPR